jgi:hypothetical protein
VACGVQQRTEDARLREFELPPDVTFRTPMGVMEIRQGQKDRTVREVWPGDDIFNAIENCGAGGLEQRFIGVGIELADCKAAPARQSAQCIGGVGGNVGQVVEASARFCRSSSRENARIITTMQAMLPYDRNPL